jgi:preprotein translocase subunit SecA
MRDIQSTFTERFLKIQVTAEPSPPRRMAPPPPPAPTPAPMSGADDLFMGAPPPPPMPAAPAAAAPAAVSSSLGRLGAPSGVVPEVGRNDPCPCGSGKKYKKCHGAGK